MARAGTATTCTLWAEGVVQQSAVFGEDLHLIRRIEADVGGNEIRLTDRVVNHGFYKTPHMYCYHINVGHPVLDEGARYLAPIADVVWAAHAGDAYRKQGVGYRTPPGAEARFPRAGLAARTGARARQAKCRWRWSMTGSGWGFEVTTLKSQFPCLYEWQNLQAGQYALGIEPSTHHVLGNQAARDRGEMIWLNHGDERRYDTVFRVLDGAAAIAASRGADTRRLRAAGGRTIRRRRTTTCRLRGAD